MRSYLDFEKPVAELEAKVEELRAMQEDGNAVGIDDEIARLRSEGDRGARGPLRGSDALAEDAGRAPPAAPALSRLRSAR